MSKYAKEEVENSKRIYKSATPKQTPDWYVKWAASITLLVAMVIRASGTNPFVDTCISFIGCAGWIAIGIMWKDKAILVLNVVACFILATGIVNSLIGV